MMNEENILISYVGKHSKLDYWLCSCNSVSKTMLCEVKVERNSLKNQSNFGGTSSIG